jgi:predicted histone-like DNA-binding protein
LTVRQLAQRAAQISTLSPVDTAAAIEALLVIIPQALAEGNIVELGAFGSFRLTAKAEGADQAQEVTKQQIRRVTARFTPGKEFKQALTAITFEKAGG